jgi:hypothetical protein
VSSTVAELTRARTCYDHLAGRLGVAITDAMIGSGWLRLDDGLALPDLTLTAQGVAWLGDLTGADLDGLRRGRRRLARTCLDWTQHRPHLAGTAGFLLCRQFLAQRWVVRAGEGRAVQVSPAGAAALHHLFSTDQFGSDLLGTDLLGIDAVHGPPDSPYET